MHRKIKSKNRKKLKPVDPFNVNSSLKTKDGHKNLAPKDDEQEVPKSFKDLFLNLQSSSAAAEKKKKKRNSNVIEGYERKPWETDKQFMARVDRSTHDYVNDQMTKIKYGLVGFEPTDVLSMVAEETPKKKKRNHDKDESESAPETSSKRKKLNPGESASSKKNDHDQKSGGDGENSKKKKQKKALEKKKQKKQQKADDDVDPLYMREVIPFGDRVDEPPHLTAIPKKAKKTQPSKAGSKDLLLKKVLDSAPAFHMDTKKRYENDGTIKCDDLAKQRVLEEERKRVIEAYRKQKKNLNKKSDE